MPVISFRTLAELSAPSEQEVELYRNIWNYHVWGYSAELIADTLQRFGYKVNEKSVKKAIKTMKSKLDEANYKDLAQGEVREYLALNAIAQQELTDLYFEARNDFTLLRRGQVRREDGSKVMQVTLRDLMSILHGIEKLAQNRAAVLTKLAEEKHNTPLKELEAAVAIGVLEDLIRTPEDIIDVKAEPVFEKN